MNHFRSDLFRSFGICFAVTAVALVITRFDGAQVAITGIF